MAVLLAMEKGNTVAEVLKLSHKRPNPGHKGLAYPAKPPPDHLWVRDDLRVWLGSKGCPRGPTR